MDYTRRGAFVGGSRLLERGMLDRTRLAWRLLRDPRVSVLKYALPAFLLVYLMSPIDAVPDLFLGIGQTDDLGIAVVAFMLLVRIIPRLAPGHVVDEHLRDLHQANPEREARPRRDDAVIDARYSVRS
jgi:uncharacterized membrane protein YkvA (DUF1232 family)